MSNQPNQMEDRLLDLMIRSATCGLDQNETKELEQLSANSEHRDEAERIELAAAAFDLTFDSGDEEMPRGIQDQILITAGEFFSKEQAEEKPAGKSNGFQPGFVVESYHEQSDNINSSSNSRWLELVTVFAAAAACIAVLLSSWTWIFPADSGRVAKNYSEFMANAPGDLVNAAWVPTHDEDAKGRVVWSDERQEGYMVFENLDINDPNAEQYQLWIFDKDPAQKYPVDGGVFNVTSTGRVVIPINAKIRVDKAVQFAVTIEEPGGVVVSKRERIPVLAVADNK